MSKTILITGATDGIGLVTAKQLLEQGHKVLLHGRNPAKLESVKNQLSVNGAQVDTFVADLSKLEQVDELAKQVASKYSSLDVVINNAGVFNIPEPRNAQGQDLRFIVNTLAPYKLTKALLPLMGKSGRVVNLSSAAQATVDLDALKGNRQLSDNSAYAQSKLALTMWSRELGLALKDSGPIVVSVNPKSLLGRKMVKDAYGIAGGDLSIGADILVRASLSEEFNDAAGLYFDNDIGQFASPHPDALNAQKSGQVVELIEALI
ncbi:SDR family NAD(P)-dependent oxidoreductase [Agarivorans litoreus]|uniref:SDR family NAD(P)-dependent oxidoreductase n=1 Tax=Agarivorans litoreus TaxID=1510455 RepID=UPI001C7D65FB|nr:SDR family NAD(P)-dependent oxidoreductase [Agarivorans litoreus]